MKNPFILCLLILLASNIHAQVGIGTVSPLSTLDVRGSFSGNYRSFTGNTTASSTDYALAFTGTTASSVTLPDATACTGRIYLVKNASTSGVTPLVTVMTTSSQTIDGASSYLLDQAYESVLLTSSGTNWNVSAQNAAAFVGTVWSLGGNNLSALQKFGTISNFDLPFITNNIERLRISNAGNVGIGASVFNVTTPEKLLVQAGTTTSFNLVQGHGKINNYLQLNVQNDSAGTLSSSDLVATADNGTENINYVDMGINSSGNTQNVMGGANDAYLYSTGNNFLIANGTPSKALVFMTGGTTQSTNEKMRIDGSGNVGIGTNSTTSKFEVSGTGGTLSEKLTSTAATDRSILQSTNTAANGGTIDIRGYGISFAETIFGNSMSGSSALIANNTPGASILAMGTYASNDFVFGTSNAERMRITSGGSVGIGTNAPTTMLDVNGTVKMRSTVQVGVAGTPLNAIIRFANQSITDNTTFDYTTPRTETFTLTGVTQYATVIVTPRSALPAGMVLAYAYASAANTVKLNLQTSSSSTSLGTVIFDITVIQ